MNQAQIRQAVLYSLFVNQNPSLKNYMITTRRSNLMSHEQMVVFVGRIQGRRSSFPIYSYALTYTFSKSVSPN
jgi:hypothetical protein